MEVVSKRKITILQDRCNQTVLRICKFTYEKKQAYIVLMNGILKWRRKFESQKGNNSFKDIEISKHAKNYGIPFWNEGGSARTNKVKKNKNSFKNDPIKYM